MVWAQGFPMEASSTPPVCACLAMSCKQPSVQLEDPFPTCGQLPMASARVGHMTTQRWQFTHFMSSAVTRPASSSRQCTSLEQDLTHTPQRVQRSASRRTL